jgi:hypothetical protein
MIPAIAVHRNRHDHLIPNSPSGRPRARRRNTATPRSEVIVLAIPKLAEAASATTGAPDHEVAIRTISHA